MGRRYYTAVVDDTADPEQRGRLKLVIGELLGEAVYPDWIEPRIAGGPGAAAMFFVPPAGSVVIVEADDRDQLRWSGGQFGGQNSLPAFLLANYPARSGFSAPGGQHLVVADDDVGVYLVSGDPDDPDAARVYLNVNGAEDTIQAATAAGSTLRVAETQAMVMNAAGDLLLLDSDTHILLLHNAGVEYLELKDGTATLAGGSVILSGGAVTVIGGGITLTSDNTGVAPTEAVILGESFLSDLNTVLAEIVTGLAAVPFTATQTAAMQAKVAASLAARAPYLSDVVEVE